MDIHRMMQESTRQDFAVFLTRMLEAFKINVQILERCFEEEQKFTSNALREIDSRLMFHNRRIECLEAIQRTAIDEEQKRVESERQADPAKDGENH